MPIFEYKCGCGKEKEHFFEIKDYRNPVYCECGKKMKKLIPHFYWKFGGRNVMSSRTDIEIEPMSMQDSMDSFSK